MPAGTRSARRPLARRGAGIDNVVAAAAALGREDLAAGSRDAKAHVDVALASAAK